ncbi:NifB/NifX family molybdenum-iron cluster-binding protein [Syntrophotalea acetylenica]|uniref:NifB/NifX family molybdenum-iron cluster-binding protein n=1 Tax=Syntrophotalea acetylenica TaxID=29542 RepID=UPI002A358E61|nr:NifB/NifX family molybdenum-iron cluster-binding protein [Syntrophotalea acetylenica]
MDPHSPQTSTCRIALPCYENRVMPRFGMARTFIFADINRSKKQITAITEKNWESSQPMDLPAWLQQQRVEGVLCGGIHPRYQIALEAKGMWVAWGFRGEIEAVLNQWLDAEKHPDSLADGFGFVSCCRIQHAAASNKISNTPCPRRKKP